MASKVVGPHENYREVVQPLTDLCRGLSVTTMIQVGANDGFEVSEIVKGIPGLTGIAIEANAICQPCDDNIQYHHAVIGATDCVVDFYIHQDTGLSGHFRRAEEPAVPLQQMRLDTFCSRHGIEPDALIIDTEGTTLDVLDGCGTLLGGVKLIYAECQTSLRHEGMRHLDDVKAFLEPMGFSFYDKPPSYDCGGQGNYTWIREQQ